jgi:hypothetical protein
MGYTGNLENLNRDATAFLIDKLFNQKEKILTEKLLYFFQNQVHLLIDTIDILKVITFEFDAIMSFSFTVYPDPTIIPQSYWKEQFTLDCSTENDSNVLELLCEKFNLEEWDDAFVSKDNEAYYVDIYEILNELHYNFFQNAWKKATQKCGVTCRGFLFWHDGYHGIDLDTGKPAKSEDVISILTDEGYDFKVLKETERKPIEYFKNDEGLFRYAIISLASFSEFQYIRPSDKEQIVMFEAFDQNSFEANQNSLNYLIANEKIFFDSLCMGIIHNYQSVISKASNVHYALKIETIEDVKQNILIRDVKLVQKRIDGFSLILIGGSCAWDEDHGFGVLMHKNKVIEIGIWDDSF